MLSHQEIRAYIWTPNIETNKEIIWNGEPWALLKKDQYLLIVYW